MAGLDLTDASSRLLVRFVPHLSRLDLSQCGNITDQTVHTLTTPISPLRESLTHLNLAGESQRRHCSSIPSVCGSVQRCYLLTAPLCFRLCESDGAVSPAAAPLQLPADGGSALLLTPLL